MSRLSLVQKQQGRGRKAAREGFSEEVTFKVRQKVSTGQRSLGNQPVLLSWSSGLPSLLTPAPYALPWRLPSSPKRLLSHSQSALS